MSIVFEEPPEPVRAPRSKWARIAAELRERPGDWARVRECDGYGVARSVATAIRRGRRVGMEPAGSFEATVRPMGGSFAVYARYVGEAGS